MYVSHIVVHSLAVMDRALLSSSMKVDVSPVAVVATDPQSGDEALGRHWPTTDWVHGLSGTDVGDVRRAAVVVKDVNARINHVDTMLEPDSRRRGGVVEIKLLKSFAFRTLFAVACARFGSHTVGLV